LEVALRPLTIQLGSLGGSSVGPDDNIHGNHTDLLFGRICGKFGSDFSIRGGDKLTDAGVGYEVVKGCTCHPEVEARNASPMRAKLTTIQLQEALKNTV
jgi:hypothetical protein